MADINLDILLDAILPHVAFDGWGDLSFAAACEDLGIEQERAQLVAPRRAIDLAAHCHRRADRAMYDAMMAADLDEMRYRDRVAHGVWLRLEAIEDPEAVRRALALFALPHLAVEGSGLVWETADTIWRALGDSSQDVNWYSKRATLSAVWSAVLLYWLGDESEGKTETRGFIDRRIDNVMQVEKVKAGIRGNRVLSAAFAPLDSILSCVKAPAPRHDMPGPSNARG